MTILIYMSKDQNTTKKHSLNISQKDIGYVSRFKLLQFLYFLSKYLFPQKIDLISKLPSLHLPAQS